MKFGFVMILTILIIFIFSCSTKTIDVEQNSKQQSTQEYKKDTCSKELLEQAKEITNQIQKIFMSMSDKKSDYIKALDLANKAIELCPNAPNYYVMKLQVQHKLVDIKGMFETISILQKFYPNEPYFIQQEGLYYEAIREYDKAELLYKKAYELENSILDTLQDEKMRIGKLSEKMITLRLLYNDKRAKELFDSVFAKNPENRLLQVFKGFEKQQRKSLIPDMYRHWTNE